jgi:hypothetical protein
MPTWVLFLAKTKDYDGALNEHNHGLDIRETSLGKSSIYCRRR